MKVVGRTPSSQILRIDIQALPPDEQASFHMNAVLPNPLLPFEAIEIRCLNTRVRPTVTGPRLFLGGIEEAVEAALRYRFDWDVFFGVGTRACPAALSMGECPHEQKGADHVSRLQAIWGDFDAKAGGRSEDQLRAMLQELPLPPEVLVGSGKGLHAYWPLLEPTKEAKRVEAVNRSLRIGFGADNAVDAARILRVAGTFNHKYGEPLPVRLLRCPDGL
jgi:hypothetical protein